MQPTRDPSLTMAFSFKSLFTKDEASFSRQAGAGGRLNLNPGVPAAPTNAPDSGGMNLNRQAMQPEGISPFATPYSGSPFVAAPAAVVSPFEAVGAGQGGNFPFAAAGAPGNLPSPHGAGHSPSPVAAHPAFPSELAPPAAASPFGVGINAPVAGGGVQARQSPFENAEGASPFAEIPSPAVNPRVLDLESRGFDL